MNLSCVESIPHMIHHTIELVTHFGSIDTQINRRECSVFFVGIIAFKHQDTKMFLVADVSIHICLQFAVVEIWGNSRVVGDDLEF